MKKERLVSGHLPHGRCGLKSSTADDLTDVSTSPSTRKVWIEISKITPIIPVFSSPSTRKVWIEIERKMLNEKRKKVTFHTEGVD